MATFTEDFTRLRQDCDELHQDHLEFIQNVRTEIQTLREDEVPGLLAGFRADHAEMASQLRSDLAEFADDLATGGEIFRGGQPASFPTPEPNKAKKPGKAKKSRKK